MHLRVRKHSKSPGRLTTDEMTRVALLFLAREKHLSSSRTASRTTAIDDGQPRVLLRCSLNNVYGHNTMTTTTIGLKCTCLGRPPSSECRRLSCTYRTCHGDVNEKGNRQRPDNGDGQVLEIYVCVCVYVRRGDDGKKLST